MLKHLTSHRQFQLVLSGMVLARTSHFVLHGLDYSFLDTPHRDLFSGHPIWMGVMVPKRWAKRAVTRNTIKRQIYAIGRDYETSLVLSAYVVRLRRGFDRVQYVSATSKALKTAMRDELTSLFTEAAGRLVSVAPKVCS
jgi:ribonuclease P protein component